MINLKPRDATTLKAIFQTYAPFAQVWAYGSRVTGQGHETSDLDLVIRNAGALETPLASLAALRNAIEASSLPFLVDLHDWALLPTGHRQQIADHHVVLITPVQSEQSQPPPDAKKEPAA